MKHHDKHFWGLIEQAAKVCRIERNGVTIKLYPNDRTKMIFTVHVGPKAIHPLRRYLNRICVIKT